MTLPSLKKNGYDVMEQEKENREISIEGGTDNSDIEVGGGGSNTSQGLYYTPY